MAEMKDLMREYERARFPEHRRLDLHGEGPQVARDRALHWIQSRAHESPGEELLLIVERGGRPGRTASPIAQEINRLLEELHGRLIDWWQPFTPGSVALRIALRPAMLPTSAPKPPASGEGRTEATAGAAGPPPEEDIPPELRELAQRTAQLRIEREGLSIRLVEVVLREIWIETQAIAMDRTIPFGRALAQVFDTESRRLLEE